MPPRTTKVTPDFLTLPPYAALVADALSEAADLREKQAAEIGQERLMDPLVRLLRRAATQTRPYGTEETTDGEE